MPTNAKKTDPVACKYCVRFAPEKCVRHGGPRRVPGKAAKASTARKVSARPSANGHNIVATWLDEQITSLKAELAFMERFKARV